MIIAIVRVQVPPGVQNLKKLKIDLDFYLFNVIPLIVLPSFNIAYFAYASVLSKFSITINPIKIPNADIRLKLFLFTNAIISTITTSIAIASG